MTAPLFVDPITYAWKILHPKVPLPEKLKWEPRGKFLNEKPSERRY